LMRVKNLHMDDIRNTEIHNARLYDSLGIRKPDNIDPEKTYLNTNYNEGQSLYDAIMKPIKEKNCLIRCDSVVALEFVVGICGNDTDKFYEKYDERGFLYRVKDWFIYKKFNLQTREDFKGKFWGFLPDNSKYKTVIIHKGSIVSHSFHFDEQNPHAHIIVVPIEKKRVNWKNKNGSGSKEEYRLSAKEHTGGREKLRQLQQDYFEYLTREFPAKAFDLPENYFKRGEVDPEKKKFYRKKPDYD
jgi:hypothetical protein